VRAAVSGGRVLCVDVELWLQECTKEISLLIRSTAVPRKWLGVFMRGCNKCNPTIDINEILVIHRVNNTKLAAREKKKHPFTLFSSPWLCATSSTCSVKCVTGRKGEDKCLRCAWVRVCVGGDGNRCRATTLLILHVCRTALA
jgi:hypothetical protein